MGKAFVLRHIEKCEYEVRAIVATRDLARAQAESDSLTADLEQAEELLELADQKRKDAVDQLATMIDEGATDEEKEAQQRVIQQSETEYGLLKADRDRLHLEKEMANKRVEDIETEIDSHTPDEPIKAWCADYTDDLSGETDTIEINSDPKLIQMAPSGVAPIASGPTLMEMTAQNSFQAFFNWAVYPGWQRHMPTYRIGTIEQIYFDGVWKARVKLDEAESHAKKQDTDEGFEINPEVSDDIEYTFRYMTCDHVAFEKGDRVVCSYPERNFESGVIIGFEKEPRPCDLEPNFLLLYGDDGAGVYSAAVWNPKHQMVVVEPCIVHLPYWVSEVDEDGEVKRVPNPANPEPWNEWLKTIIQEDYSGQWSSSDILGGGGGDDAYWDSPYEAGSVELIDDTPTPANWYCTTTYPDAAPCVEEYDRTVESSHCDGGDVWFRAYPNCREYPDKEDFYESCYDYEWSHKTYWRWPDPWHAFEEGSKQRSEFPADVNALPSRSIKLIRKGYPDEAICFATENTGEMHHYGFYDFDSSVNAGEMDVNWSWEWTFRAYGKEWTGSAALESQWTCSGCEDMPDYPELYGGFLEGFVE